MAIVENPEFMPLDMEEDPDDYRPSSRLAVVIDPARPGRPHVEALTVFCEKIAAGDRIPLHRHLNEDEVLFVVDGVIEATVGEDAGQIGAGAVVPRRHAASATWVTVWPGSKPSSPPVR